MLASLCSFSFVKTLCDKYIVEKMLIPEVDNMALSPLYLANFLSGSSYRESLYYAQGVVSDGLFRLYDYGKIKNKEVYGADEPPTVPIQDFSIPTAIWHGLRDSVVLSGDIDILVEALADNVISRKTIDGDHWTFSVGSDMSYFKNDVISVLDQYNPKDLI